MGTVNGLFDSIAHAFRHIAEDIGAKLAPVMAPMFGVPPEAITPLAMLLIKAHAGSKRAAARVHELQKNGGNLRGAQLPAELVNAAIVRVNVALHDHPHWSHMLSHAQKQVAKAKAAA